MSDADREKETATEVETVSTQPHRSRRLSPKQLEMERLREQLEATESLLRQTREAYREMAAVTRQQKAQIEYQRMAEAIYAVALGDAATESEMGARCSRLIRQLMETFEAGGGVLWTRMGREDTLSVQGVEGRVAPTIQLYPIETTLGQSEVQSAVEIRALCEQQLRAAAPVTASLFPIEIPTLVALLKHRGDADSPEIIGAVGLCDPRKPEGFDLDAVERLNTLAGPLGCVLETLAVQRRLVRQTRELTTLYDLSRLTQTATPEQICDAIVMQAQRVVPADSVTLYLLDPAREYMEVRAARGRAVNLLNHIPLGHGTGISGWVAASGRQVHVADLNRETELRNCELIPMRVRSFVATPLRMQNRTLGALTLSHSQPNAFSPEDLHLLALFAEQAAAAIARTEQMHSLELLAITDDLTRVYNTRYFHRRLKEEIRRARRYRVPVTLLMLDVDHFKHVNDRYGHASGDRVLRDLAELLRNSVRETEIVARYGGEEFGLILPQTDAEQAVIAAERVRRTVEAHPFTTIDGKPLRITVSAGLATCPIHSNQADLLFQQADAALNAAKLAGRNCVRTTTIGVLNSE